jgi:hypothetical protein
LEWINKCRYAYFVTNPIKAINLNPVRFSSVVVVLFCWVPQIRMISKGPTLKPLSWD